MKTSCTDTKQEFQPRLCINKFVLTASGLSLNIFAAVIFKPASIYKLSLNFSMIYHLRVSSTEKRLRLTNKKQKTADILSQKKNKTVDLAKQDLTEKYRFVRCQH
jgi:hypothetical protein